MLPKYVSHAVLHVFIRLCFQTTQGPVVTGLVGFQGRVRVRERYLNQLVLFVLVLGCCPIIPLPPDTQNPGTGHLILKMVI